MHFSLNVFQFLLLDLQTVTWDIHYSNLFTGCRCTWITSKSPLGEDICCVFLAAFKFNCQVKHSISPNVNITRIPGDTSLRVNPLGICRGMRRRCSTYMVAVPLRQTVVSPLYVNYWWSSGAYEGYLFSMVNRSPSFEYQWQRGS